MSTGSFVPNHSNSLNGSQFLSLTVSPLDLRRMFDVSCKNRGTVRLRGSSTIVGVSTIRLPDQRHPFVNVLSQTVCHPRVFSTQEKGRKKGSTNSPSPRERQEEVWRYVGSRDLPFTTVCQDRVVSLADGGSRKRRWSTPPLRWKFRGGPW